jgi:hypothetical protein
VSSTGTRAGAVTVGGLSLPPAAMVKAAGSRTSDGGVEVVLGAVGGLVSGAVGGAPVAVSGVVWVAVVVVAAVVVVVAAVVVVAPAAVDVVPDAVADSDDPHPTAVPSSKKHKRTANPLTFAG